jgi:hypothetical protein
VAAKKRGAQSVSEPTARNIAMTLIPYRVQSVSEPTARKADIAVTLITHHETEYARTGSPVHVWRAFAEARRAGLDVPLWVLQYLDGVAETFWRWSSSGQSTPSNLSNAIARALGMLRGRGEDTVFAEFKDVLPVMLAYLVAQSVRNPRGPQKLYLAWDDVAKTAGVPPRMVRRAWEKHKDRFIVA